MDVTSLEELVEEASALLLPGVEESLAYLGDFLRTLLQVELLGVAIVRMLKVNFESWVED